MSKLYRMARAIQERLHTQGTELVKACEAGVLPVVRTIIPRLYPPNSEPIWGVPPPDLLLTIAIEHKHVSVLEYLLASLPRPPKQTPWDLSAFYRRDAIASFRKDHSNNELIWEAVNSGSPSVLRVLFDAGINVNDTDDHAQQPIDQAVELGDLKMAKFLLEKGASPDGRDLFTGLTTLANAVKNSYQDIMLALIEHGARIQTTGALIIAVKEGHIDIARLLLEKGADVNEINDLCYIGDYDLEHNYDRYEGGKEVAEEETAEEEIAEEEDNVLKASTALHIAARYGQIEMVKFLLENGASKHISDWHSDLPVHKAKQGGI